MIAKYMLVLVVLGLIFGLSYSSAAVVGIASIRAPAVVITNNTGSLTNITLTITTGNGNVFVTGPHNVGSSTVQSATTAAQYASNYTGHPFSNYNFTYNIKYAGDNVSGSSAGAAMTILAVSAFQNKPLRTDFTMTGTISANGSIGEIGGVYDKVGAAKNAGIALVLVPKVRKTDPEDELYLLVQTNYGIPLVQVANISQAAHFAFSSLNGIANQTTYNFYTNYNANLLPVATLNCTGYCNQTVFKQLLNATFSLTRTSIRSLNSNPKFSNISNQLGLVLNQSIAIANHGYLYTGADFAFLDYVNTFYFNGYSTNRSSALAVLTNVQTFCQSLIPPQLTTSNYNYVINAELRQAWGNYTINNVVSSYNSSQIDSNQILDELYLGAQANGWCTAANLVYNVVPSTGTYVAPSSTLKNIALNRITRALPYGLSIYLTTAQQAYKQNNYPLAILDADYAFALANASTKSSLSTGQLINLSTAVASNSNYGVWGTEFAKESQFYTSESALASNSSKAKTYAESGYAAALLAQQISNDTRVISRNLVAVQGPQVQNVDIQAVINYITYTQEITYALFLIVIIILLINIMLMVKLLHLLHPRKITNKKAKK